MRAAHQGLPGRGDPPLLAAGFLPGEISHTGTNLSDRDLGGLPCHPGVRLNLDLVSQVERLGRLAPGREGGCFLGSHQERRPVRGTGPADEVRHRRPPRAARPYPAAARQLPVTCRSTRAAPNCCSRSSSGGTNATRSGSGPAFLSDEWGSIFCDPRPVAAIVDRVTFNAHIIETGTESYRLRTSGLGGLTRPRLECQAIAMMATIALAPARRRLAARVSSSSESGRHPPWHPMCAQAAMIWCSHSTRPHRTSGGGGTRPARDAERSAGLLPAAAASERRTASLVLAFGSY